MTTTLQDVQPQQSMHVLTQRDEFVEIEVGGSVDGEMTRDPIGYGNYSQAWENMISIQMHNSGDDAINAPWIDVDGRHRWRSTEEILAGILTPRMSDADKARAIWEFARQHRYHATTGDDEVKDTVKMLNVYGYTLCWDEAYTLSNLWQAAGLEVRRGLPHGHCTTEVYYDGAYHLLDSDEHLLVLCRDNETVADEGQISRDHDLMKRSHAYGILSAERRETVESAASLFCHEGPRSGGRPELGDHRMQVRLRPGELLEWRWDARGRFHGFGEPPPRYCNGIWRWTVPVTDLRWASTHDGVVVAGNDLIAHGDAELVYDLQTPYALVGGRIRADTEGDVSWAVSRGDRNEWEPVVPEAQGFSLDPHLASDSPACYHLRLRLRGVGWKLGRLEVEADLQMAPLSLPSLRLGTNRIHYTDDSQQRQLTLRCHWLEREDWPVPTAPTGLSPATGATQATSRARLTWSPVDGAADYHLRLGTDPEVDRALSPVFDKLVSRTPERGASSWVVPEEGLLNPQTDYYWKVRARSAQGVWGPFSPVAHFQIQAPGVPLAPALEMDWATRRAILTWEPNPQGTLPVAYEIHGSDEKGFSARREPYEIYLGNECNPDSQVVPGNLLTRIDAVPRPRSPVIGPDIATELQMPFYRIVAIDAAGVRSGPSDMVEAPRPLVTTQLPSQIPADTTTRAQLRCLSSRGDLRAQSKGPHRYAQAFRDADRIEYLLDEGPPWIELETDTGMLLLSPPLHGALGNHTVTIRVRNGQGGVDVVGFDVHVVRRRES